MGYKNHCLFDSCRACGLGQRMNCLGAKIFTPPLRGLIPFTMEDVLPKRRHRIADDVMRFRKLIDDHSMGGITVLNFHEVRSA